jgi:hypothetical protein
LFDRRPAANRLASLGREHGLAIVFRILAWMKAGQESAIEGCLNGTAILDVWYEVIGLTPTKNLPILYYAAASRVSI